MPSLLRLGCHNLSLLTFSISSTHYQWLTQNTWSTEYYSNIPAPSPFAYTLKPCLFFHLLLSHSSIHQTVPLLKYNLLLPPPPPPVSGFPATDWVTVWGRIATPAPNVVLLPSNYQLQGSASTPGAGQAGNELSLLGWTPDWAVYRGGRASPSEGVNGPFRVTVSKQIHRVSANREPPFTTKCCCKCAVTTGGSGLC